MGGSQATGVRFVNAMWTYTGRGRPPFAETPGPGQESVWDYPRPPRVETCRRTVEVSGPAGRIARSNVALRVLETAAPPTIYLPPDDVDFAQLEVCLGSSFCEWKGTARYFALVGTDKPVAWCYPKPTAAYAGLRDYVSFYPGRVACTLGGERVQAQAGDFYGGWITDDIVGPFKGDPGTAGW